MGTISASEKSKIHQRTTQTDQAAATLAQGAKADSAVQSIVAGDNVTVDARDP